MAFMAAPVADATDVDVPVPAVSLTGVPDPTVAGAAGVVSATVGVVSRLTAASCQGAGLRPGAASNATLRRAGLCLINVERARRGRPAIGGDSRLASAAQLHAGDMARKGYFGHVSPSGRTPARRARRAGWRRGVAEVLAWGCGSRSTPRATVRAWLNSPPHRAIILGSARVAGVGMVSRPGCGRRAYWVADLG